MKTALSQLLAASLINDTSGAAGLKSGQFNRERNFEKANNEYRTRNNECQSKVFYRFILI